MAWKKILSIVFCSLLITFLLNLQSINGRLLVSHGSAKVTSPYVLNNPPPQNPNSASIADKADPPDSAPPAPRSRTPIHN
ncbi:hypothetical protein SLA2020_120870 [Shorea laevis]